MRLFSALALCVVCLCAPAAAQTQLDPVREHYRAYRAAMDRGDLAAAATEGELALAASEAANGDRTGVLALNLALVRLQANDAAGAVAPAQRAMALAEAGAAGTDRTIAALALGRAELAVSGQVGADRLNAVLTSESIQAPAVEMYEAAMALGGWALRQRQFELADATATIAASHAAGSIYGESFGLARAKTLQATAIFFGGISQRGRVRLTRDNAEDAYRLAGDAAMALMPLSENTISNSGLTLAQMAYSEAIVIRGAIAMTFHSRGWRLPPLPPEAQGDADGMAELGPRNLTLPRCMLRMTRPRGLTYPVEELANGGMGSVGLWLRLDESGTVVGHAVVTHIGSDAFADAVRQQERWDVLRMEDSAPNCRMPRSMLGTVRFGIG